jgi:hypothetical protein
MSPPTENEIAWRPDPLDVSIDIVGACNLACPACGHGQYPTSDRYLGTMDPELFERILDKLERELAPERPRVHLFNWGEPLLHPQAASFIRSVKARGLVCRLSSNLVRPRNLRAVVEAEPDWLRVSVSGFTQAVYGQTHRGGDIERVKENMRLLRSHMDELRSSMAVEVNYHVYRHNIGPDYESMKELALGLGFGFQPIWSIAGSPEKVIGWLEAGVPPEDAPHVSRLVHSPELSREISLEYRHLLAPGECPIREATLINADGSVDLCCAAYAVAPVAASYLAATTEELQRTKREHALCVKCMEHGLHLTAIYAGRSERDARGLAILAEHLGMPEPERSESGC